MRNIVGRLRDAVYFLEDELADRHALRQPDPQRADVPDLQPERAARVAGLRRLVAKARVDRRGRDMHPDRQAGHAAAALHAGGKATDSGAPH